MRETEEENRGRWEYPSLVGKLMSLKRSCCWWKTSQPDDGRLRRKIGDCLKEGRSSMKNLLTQWRETKEENQRLMIEGCRSQEIEGWRSRKVEVLTKTIGKKLHAVTCNAAKDVRLGSYPNSSKNTMKIKRSSLFSSFVSAVGWLSSLSFGRLRGLDCWSSHRWCSVNSRRSRGRLIRMILVERADKLSEVLDRWGWLPGIFFLRISFPWDQIVETW